jgi:hypothetical protein
MGKIGPRWDKYGTKMMEHRWTKGRTTEGSRSKVKYQPCWKNVSFIEGIVLGNQGKYLKSNN